VEFEWDPAKDRENQDKHGVSFEDAVLAWLDLRRVTRADRKHSGPKEQRYFLFGEVSGRVLTVRFSRRGDKVRILGAGYWREGRTIHEEANRFRR
jgi:uncharacterized DUF497 family protein